MDKYAVLVVGAGALGVVTGYHLALAGAEITFLVRPGRLKDLQKPQQLYCFDNNETRGFSAYSSIASADEAAQKQYDFLLLTLDGASCRSEEGQALLQSLGEAIRPGDAVLVVCGMDVREHCREMMGLPGERVLEGTQRMLSYQVDRANMPVHPPTDPGRVAEADFAYRHTGGNDGFTIVSEPSAAARPFADLYNRCGVSRCRSMGRGMYTMFTRSFFPVIAIYERAGWPDAAALVEQRELLTLGARAMSEILSLPEHGWRGKLASLVMGPKALAKTLTSMERDCLPMDYTAFNRFHHGGKVREQNLQVMRRCAEAGRAAGRPMPALTEIIEGQAMKDSHQGDYIAMAEKERGRKKRIAVFHRADAGELPDGMMPREGIDDSVMAGLARLAEAGATEGLGERNQVLFREPGDEGMSLIHVWFKSDYVLPFHSHSTDCLYYVLGGELKMGSHLLRKGDGVFIPADQGYGYEAGPEGMELLEFRNATHFNLFFRANTPERWEKIADVFTRRATIWAEETVPPSERGDEA